MDTSLGIVETVFNPWDIFY